MIPSVFQPKDIADVSASTPIPVRAVPLNTTLHPGVFGVDRAAIVHNLDTSRGILEPDERYRRVQEPPEATITGEACTNPLAPDSASAEARTGSTASWSSPSNAIPPDGTYATAVLGVGDKTQTLKLTDFASTGLTSGMALTRLRLQVLHRAVPAGEAPVEVVDDLIQLTVDGSPVGGNQAILSPLPSTAAVREYEFDPSEVGITAAMIVANRVGAIVGYKALPETAYDLADFSITYTVDGQGFEEDSNSPDNTIPWSLGTPETAPSFTIQSLDTVMEGGFNHAQQNGTVTVRATRDDGTATRIVVEIYSKAEGVGDEIPTNTGSADNGLGDTSTAVYTLLGDTYMGEKSEGTHRYWFDLTDHVGTFYGERELTLSADGHHTYVPGGYVNDPTATASVEVEATISEPSDATVGVDSVQLVACYETEVATTTTPQGLGIGRFGGDVDVAAVIGGGAFDVDASDTQAAMDYDWNPERSGVQLAAGNWSIWAYGQWLFYAHPTDGVYRRTIGEDDWEPVYKDTESPGSTGDATATSVVPSYDEHQVFDPAVDLPASPTSITTGGVGLTAQAEIDADDGLLYVRTNDWITGPYNPNWLQPEVTLGTPRDFSGAMAIGFKIESLTTDDEIGGNDGFNDTVANNQVTLTNSFAASATIATKVYGTINKKYGVYYGWIDITGVSEAILSDVEKIKIKFGVYQTGRGNYRLSLLYASGTFYHDTDSDALEDQNETNVDSLEYAYDYSEGSEARRARKLIVPAKTHLGGSRMFTGTYPYLGSVQSVRVPTADSPYTGAATINLYRKVGDDYQRIATGPNTEDLVFEDRLPDSEVAADTTTYPVAIMDFTEAPPSSSGVATGVSCGCAWRGSNIYAGSNGSLYMSRTNDPTEVEWDDVVLTNVPPDEEDLGPPRTLTVADDTVSPVVAMVPAESLYLFTSTEGYVMVGGETAFDSSYPKKIDGVRGAVGPRAACNINDRALVGCLDGLWVVRKTNVQVTVADELIEVTKDVRSSWQWLLGDSSETLVVRHRLGDIWCFNEDRYLHITQERNTITGEWADGRTVFDAVDGGEFGMILLLGDGHLGLIGSFTTDGGTTLAGDDGEPFEWTFRTGYLPEGKPERAHVHYIVSGDESGIAVEALTETGSSEIPVPYTGEGVKNLPFNRQVGGGFSQIEIRGGPEDKIVRVGIEFKGQKSPRRG